MLAITMEYLADVSNFCLNLTLYYSGILAGMRPCGIIVLLSDLYIAESKSQVYGSLHIYIRQISSCSTENKLVLSCIINIICIVAHFCNAILS